MKKQSLITIIIFLIYTLLYIGCDQIENPVSEDNNILPETFSVDIPSALSQDESTKKSTSGLDTLSGDEIYQYFTFFVRIGESGAEIAEHIINAISGYHTDKPMVLTYESDDDGEIKNLVVVENSEFDGIMWEFQMTISEADSKGKNKNDICMQIFWNRKPVKGIAIIKPSCIDHVHHGHQENSMLRIDYSEAGEYGYDAHMIVYVDNLPIPPAFAKPYALKTMKMFVGKKGDIIDLYGNSNHPNAFFFSDQISVGFNWAFVASANYAENIGVAEVGLPRNNINQSSRTILLEEYSIKNVLTRALYEWNPDLPPELINAYLVNTETPGYFDAYGFVASGERPDEKYAELDVRLPDMCPYNPKDIKNLTISFKVD